jgi:hypothetical protein
MQIARHHSLGNVFYDVWECANHRRDKAEEEQWQFI